MRIFRFALFIIFFLGIQSIDNKSIATNLESNLLRIPQSVPHQNSKNDGFEQLIIAKKLIEKEEYTNAKKVLLKCEESVSASKSSYIYLSDVYYHLALVHLKNEELEQALSYTQIAYGISEKHKLLGTIAKLAKLHGDIQLLRQNINEAIESYRASHSYFEENNKQKELFEVYIKMAQCFIIKKNFRDALNFVKHAENHQIGNTKLSYELMMVKANALINLGDTKSAIPILKTIRKSSDLKDVELLKINHILTRTYINKGEIVKAEVHAKEMAVFLQGGLLINNRLKHSCYITLKNLYQKKNDFKKAFQYLEKAVRVQNKINLMYRGFDNLNSELKSKNIKKHKHSTNLTGFIEDHIIETISALIVILLIISLIIKNQLRTTEKLYREKELKDALQSKYDLSIEKNKELSIINKEKDRLMSIVAHDLRSPINKAQNINYLIQQTGSLNQEQQQMTKLMNDVLQHGDILIKDILFSDYVENECNRLTLQKININDFIDENLIPFKGIAQNKQIKLIFNQSEEQFKVKIDTIFLRRVLDNLVSNAIKFTLPLRNIYVSIENKRNEDTFQLIVKDEGIGIAKEDQKFLFKKFKKLSSRPTGGESSSGLGLSITKVLIKKLNGRIEFESRTNKGTTFTVHLPKEMENSEHLNRKELLLDDSIA